jgi:zinc transporter 13
MSSSSLLRPTVENLADYFMYYPLCKRTETGPPSHRELGNSSSLLNKYTSSSESESEAHVAVMSLILQGLLNPEFQKWAYSVLGCGLVGVAGIVPFFIFRPAKAIDKNGVTQYRSKSVNRIEPKLLNLLLSFSVGSLLGDVFLHLLPEAWERARANDGDGHHSLNLLGLWILIGIISFVICEKLVSSEEEEYSEVVVDNNNKPSQASMYTGYFNLLANIFDNFTHGLAVGGSFIISNKVGLLTTAAILLHEIPHEIGDFAILLRSGFDPWSAAKAQLSTASVGLLGAILALLAESAETEIGHYTWWILPFTAGCFISIALNNLLPDLLKETETKESLKQFLALLLGIGVMGLVSMYHI